MKEKSLSEKILEEVSNRPPWLDAWQGIATLTDGLYSDDPRLPVIEALLKTLDEAFLANQWEPFEAHVQKLKKLLTPEKA